MVDTATTPEVSWDITSPPVAESRQRFGRAVLWVSTAAFLILVIIQVLHTTGAIELGFGNWRPILYAYLAWAALLCVGVVLARGQAGQRALFVLPALLFTISMVVFPTAFGLYIAFTDWNLSSFEGRQFSGLDNLRKLQDDTFFWGAMKNMVFYVATVLVQFAIAFGLALALNADIRGRKFFRTAFLLPFMLSPVAVGWMIGKSMLDPRYGPVATFVEKLGWEDPTFLATPWIARITVASLDAWVWIPFMMVLILAGLQALPHEVMESARVDGANGWRAFKDMIFPLMLPVSVTAIILRAIFSLKLADIVITVTGGAPGGATDTVTSYVIREYRTRSNVGYGTLMAQFYLVVIIIVITIFLSAANRWLRKVS